TAPCGRRVRLAVKGHVEGNDVKVFCEFLVRQQMTPLPAVRARSVQADQRNALAVLLEIDAVRLTADLDMDVAAGHRFDVAAHAATSAYCRGRASTSLKYCRFARKGCRSPSRAASPRWGRAS